MRIFCVSVLASNWGFRVNSKTNQTPALLLLLMAVVYYVAIGKRPESGVAGRHALAGLWTVLIFSGVGMAEFNAKKHWRRILYPPRASSTWA